MLNTEISPNLSSQFIGGILGSGNAMTEEYLAQRFSRDSRVKEEVTYEFTDDPALLHQYYRLREEMYISTWGLKNFSGMQDKFDEKSKVAIARIGRLCVGGCRLTYKYPNSLDKLPLEGEGVSISDIVDYNGWEFMCSEYSRFAILPEYQNSNVTLGIIDTMVRDSLITKTKYTFFVSPVVTARAYRKALNALGIGMETRRDVPVPDCEEFEGVKMVVSMIDWAKESAKKNAAAASSEAKNEELTTA